MSPAVVYYSTKCNHSRDLMKFIVEKNLNKHFTAVCIDDKRRDDIPVIIDRVPTIIHNNKVIVDEQLFEYVESMINDQDVDAFDDLGRGCGRSMTNSIYSFVDDTAQESMPTGGSSGLFLDLTRGDLNTHIYTPEEQDMGDSKKIKINLEELLSRRENDIKLVRP